jgi:hypothetical protein
MKVMAKKKFDEAQVERFKEAARMLGCDEDESAFDAKLKKIANAQTAKVPATRAAKSKKRA